MGFSLLIFITLIDSDNTTWPTDFTTTEGEIKTGSTITQVASIYLDEEQNAIVAKVVSGQASDGAKALAESWLTGLTLATLGSDLIADKGIDAARNASVRGNDIGLFFAISGGDMTYNTGSSVDMDNISLMLGIAKNLDLDLGRLTIGVFAEYGYGDYDTYNSFSGSTIHGDGDAYYYGAGFLGRLDFTQDMLSSHPYVEFSARAGSLHNDYDNYGLRDAVGNHASFDNSTSYFGLHVGGGYIFSLADELSLDLYGKFFWTHESGDDLTLSTGELIDFDSADSSRLRLGARARFDWNEMFKGYVGLAWEHEFDGDANATTNGYDIAEPSLEGDTGIGEIGVTITPVAEVPFSIDLNLQGYVGEREGCVGGLMLQWLL